MAALERSRTHLTCGLEGPRNTATTTTAGVFAAAGISNDLKHGALHRNFGIEIVSMSDSRVIFDLVGIDVSFANAFRRILLSEVPTIAFETINIWQNTGVIQDEVLAHRIGLIPLQINPDLLEFRRENESITEDNAVKLALRVKCTPDNVDRHTNCLSVYAEDFTWLPQSDAQKQRFGDSPPAPVIPRILITKLRPGQEIELQAFGEKGIGKTHTKWSPVCTATYRLMPNFEFPKGPLVGAEAEELKEICPLGVFDIEDGGQAFAKHPRNCTTCRICLERFPEKIKLEKVKTHYIFSVESTGCIPAVQLFSKAIDVLREKAEKTRQSLEVAMRK